MIDGAKIIELVFDGFTAIGTVGAVIISLWSVFHRKRKFEVKGFSVNCWENVSKLKKNCLSITFENLLEVPMELHAVELLFSTKKMTAANRHGWTLKDEFVAPLSQYEMLLPLERGWAYSSLGLADTVTCEVRTSFGNKSVPFPKKQVEWLCSSLEVEENTGGKK